MSSILKALKKLEKETSQEIKTPSWPQPIDTRETLNRKTRKARLFRMFLSVLFIGVAVVGTGWFVLSQKPLRISGIFSPDKASHQKETENSSEAGPAPVTAQKESAVPKSVPVSEKKTDQVPQNTKAISSLKDETAAKKIDPFLPARQTANPEETEGVGDGAGAQDAAVLASGKPDKSASWPPKPASADSVKSRQPVEKKAPLFSPPPLPKGREKADLAKPVFPKPVTKRTQPSPAPKKEVRPAPEPLPAVAQKETKAPEEPAPTPEKAAEDDSAAMLLAHHAIPEKSANESGLEIQALVWSPDAKDRMAVINGSIVRMGGSVEGASVRYIGNDYIIFRKGASEWRTPFKLN